jgi:hypothetical protein
MIFISVFGKLMYRFLYLLVWYRKVHFILRDVGVLRELVCCLLGNLMVWLIFGILWINRINGQFNILWVLLGFLLWNFISTTQIYWLLAVKKDHYIYWNFHLLWLGKLGMRIKLWVSFGIGRFRVLNILLKDLKGGINNHNKVKYKEIK